MNRLVFQTIRKYSAASTPAAVWIGREAANRFKSGIDQISREFGPVAHEIDQRDMAIAPGSNQCAMDRFGSVVGQRAAGHVGQRATGFVHQKVSSCKVPVVAGAAREGDVELALCDASEP